MVDYDLALAAAISAIGAIIVAAVQVHRLRSENREQHAAGLARSVDLWRTTLEEIGALRATVELSRVEADHAFNVIASDHANTAELLRRHLAAEDEQVEDGLYNG